MLTVRQIERLWNARAYQKVLSQVLSARLESSPRLEMQLGWAAPAAAMAILRLDELNQTHTPLYGQLLRTILATQEADGGWGDALVTALCVRALLCSHGDGPAVDRALTYLANLQRPEGLWPKIPIRRMPADVFVSAFVLFQLGGQPRCAAALRLDETAGWFASHEDELDMETGRLWKFAGMRRASPGRPVFAG